MRIQASTRLRNKGELAMQTTETQMTKSQRQFERIARRVIDRAMYAQGKHRSINTPRLTDEIVQALRDQQERDALKAQRARLPKGFQWGRDAMEQFNFGKERAAAAIRGEKYKH